MMNPRQFAAVAAALYGAIFLAWLSVVWPVGFGSAGNENPGAGPITHSRIQFLAANAEIADAPRPTAMGNAVVANADVATAAKLVTGTATDARVASDEPKSIVEAALPASSQMLPPESPPVQVALASTPDPVRSDASVAVNFVESTPQATAMGNAAVANADLATSTGSVTGTATDTRA